MRFPVLLLPLLLLTTGCTYVGAWARQSQLRAELRRSPGLGTAKHLLDQSTFFVFGKVTAPAASDERPLAVVALSSTARRDEIVEACHAVRTDSYYGLNLPPGAYTLAAFRDSDSDGVFTAKELVASRALTLDAASTDHAVRDIDLAVISTAAPASAVPASFQLAVRHEPPTPDSAFYPKGTLRQLDDPIFSPAMASLGMYRPAVFVERAPLMFYALEEDAGYKVPVIFVHGIGGSARDFDDVVARLDRSRYAAWFFHYPSGADLSQLSKLFYEIFLAGTTIPKNDSPAVIVAHSMGGLVVREALNHRRGNDTEMSVGAVITIASPLGGHPGAARAKHAPLVLPSWKNLDPGSPFVAQLHRTPLASSTAYHLFTASGSDGADRASASDGVVPLASQRSDAAVREARFEHDFPCTHVGVLHDGPALTAIAAAIRSVRTIYSDAHIRELERGGYGVKLDAKQFSRIERHVLTRYARYFDALIEDRLAPVSPLQAELVAQCRGTHPAEIPMAKAWRRFAALYPDRQHRAATTVDGGSISAAPPL